MDKVMHARTCLTALLVLVASCGGPQLTAPPLEPLPDAPGLLGTEILSLEGDVSALRDALLESQADAQSAAFFHAEMDLLDGQVTRAFERFLGVVGEQPNTVLGVTAAVRANELLFQTPHLQSVSTLLERLAGTSLHPLTAAYVNSIAIEAAFRAHRHEASVEPPQRFSADGLGFPDEWRWVGPLSRYSHLNLESVQPIDTDRFLADSYTVAGKELQIRTLLADSTLMAPSLEGAGLYVFETWAHLDAAADRVAILETSLGAKLSIDDRIVILRRETGPYEPTRILAPVRLTAGWHRIRLTLGVSEDDTSFRVRLVSRSATTPGLLFTATPPHRVVLGDVGLSDGPTTLSAMLPTEVREPRGLVESYLLMILSASFADEHLGRTALDPFLALPQYSALVALTASDLVSGQSTRAPYERESARLQLVREAVELAPSAGGAAIRLALLLSSDARSDLALDLLEPLTERLSHEPVVPLLLHALYTELSLDELAEDSIWHVLEIAPNSCLAVDQLAQSLRYRDDYPPVESLPRGFQSCDEGLDYQIDHLLLPRGQIDQALGLLRRLSARHPQDVDTRRRIIELAIREGRFREASDELTAALEWGMDEAEHALLEIDMLLTQGRESDASERLTATLVDHPSQRVLLGLRSLVDRHGLLEDLRVDPTDAIESYLADQFTTTAPVVYALDYAANRYFDDGTGVAVTNQVFHVLSREALGDYGEVAIPPGAVLLRARTIKADGTILEPDDIPGKDTVSVPNLEVGDFVDIEYFEIIPKQPFRARTVIGNRFYFQVYDAPLVVSEFVVDVPSSWTDIVIDSRGGAPEPEITRGSDFHRYRFRAVGSYPLHEEPYSPPLDELLPSVRIAHNLSWDDIISEFRDRELSSTRIVEEMGPFVDQLTRDAGDDRERARLIYRYVMDELEEAGGFLSTDAVWTLGSGEGERLPVLVALLRVAGFEPQVVFLRSWSDDQSESPIPDASTYPHTVIRARVAGEEVWLSTEGRFTPFDFLNANLQGSRGVIVSGSGDEPIQWVTTPHWPDELTRQHIDVHLVLDGSGNLEANVRETISAGSWATLRTVLRELQDQRFLTQELERNLSETFPGVTLTSFNAENLEDPDAPLVITYVFTAGGFAEVEGDTITLAKRVFDRNLRGQLGSEPRRNYDLLIDYPTLEEMTLEIVLPNDYRILEVPPDTVISTPWLQYSWQGVSGGIGHNRVTLMRTTSLPVTRVTPDEYSELAEALGRIDVAESLRLTATR